MVFTGGALVVGGVARTDLAGAKATQRWARAAYRSVRDRLLILPDTLPVWPTHGPGSFCSTGGSDERTSTIGRERSSNPLLVGDPDEEEFVHRLVGGLGTYPSYFRWLPAYNRSGPVVYGRQWPTLSSLNPTQLSGLVDEGAQIVDVRTVSAFSRGHIPGSVSNELRPQFASWLVDPARPIAFITGASTDPAELVRQCVGIGFENIADELAGGMHARRSAGRPEAQIPLVGVEDLTRRQVLDIRQDSEWRAGHVPGAAHIELGSLERSELPPDQPVAVMCAHGQRSMTGASLIARHRGRTDDLAVFTGSTEQWSQHTGQHPER